MTHWYVWGFLSLTLIALLLNLPPRKLWRLLVLPALGLFAYWTLAGHFGWQRPMIF